ncbi:MAG: DUF2062 domain-containing protein [Anaerolineae bacterium]
MVYETHFSRYSFDQLSSSLKLRWHELVHSNSAQQSLALSFAVGTFISVLPIPGVDLFLVALLVSVFKQLSRAGLLAAVAVWNTFVVAPIYVLSYRVGSLIMASFPALSFGGDKQNLVVGFLVGNLLLTVVITAVSYFIVQLGIERYQTPKVRA